MKKKGITITLAADILGISSSTLRLWTKKGKVRAEQARNGYRYYQIKDLVKIKEDNEKSLGRRRGPRLTLRKSKKEI
jgi:DNA-binding transcriptional MerR regulator